MLEAPASTLPTSRPIRSLKELRAPVESELKAFDQLFRDSVRSPVGLLDTVTQYLLRQKGKQIRPLLVLLSAKACGGVTEASYRGAALVELLHTATLVHDDVVDDAERRRGMFSINAVWKNKVAVLLPSMLRPVVEAVSRLSFPKIRSARRIRGVASSAIPSRWHPS